MSNALIKMLIVVSLLFTTQLAHAIPPPDTLISVWQSLLQILGVASVFVAGAYFSVKQYFNLYIVGWKRYAFFIVVIAALVAFILWFLPLNLNLFSKNNNEGLENISIRETISRESDLDTRRWKLETYAELQQEVGQARNEKNLPALDYFRVSSYSPKTLHKIIQESPDELFLLDVRESYERSKFYLPHNAETRYGDLVQGIMRQELIAKLPKDKRIVVICHSGLRGYISSNILQQAGYTNIAYLQGGLRAWSEQKLSNIIGDEDYSSEPLSKPIYTDIMIKEATNVLKVDIETRQSPEETKAFGEIPDVIRLSFETANSDEINAIAERSKKTPIVIICSSFISCFHSNSFNFLIEKAGGKVIGIHDRSSEHLIPPIIYDEPVIETKQ